MIANDFYRYRFLSIDYSGDIFYGWWRCRRPVTSPNMVTIFATHHTYKAELQSHLQSQNNTVQLEIRFRKNLAKLKGSAVRLKSKKPKGKETMKEKKTGTYHGGI